MDHSSLSGRMFRQGSVRYIVARQQEDPNCIRCCRKDGNAVTFEKLPIPFVLEQLADEVTTGSGGQMEFAY
jgi:hypothetical protein